MSEGISFNEDFMGLEPINHRRRLNFVELDSFDRFRTAKNATDRHTSALNWLGGGRMYKEVSLEILLGGWEIIVQRMISRFFVERKNRQGGRSRPSAW